MCQWCPDLIGSRITAMTALVILSLIVLAAALAAIEPKHRGDQRAARFAGSSDVPDRDAQRVDHDTLVVKDAVRRSRKSPTPHSLAA